MRRKLAPHRPPRQPGQGALEHMLRKTMPRDADELLKMQISVDAVTPGRKSKADVLAELGEADLIYLLKTEGGPPGVCTLSHGLLSALIEVQMSGKLSASEPPERRPTRTDGIVASDIVDRWISTARFEAEVQGLTEHLPVGSYYRTETVADARLLDLALDPGDFRTMAITLDLFGGTRKGTLKFAVPPIGAGASNPTRETADEFRQNVMETETRLSIVLARMPKTIGVIGNLAVGDAFEIPIESLLSVSLEDVNGDVVGRGRLGQAGGQKAVRIVAHKGENHGDDAENDAFVGAAVSAAGGGPGPAVTADIPALPDGPSLPPLPDTLGDDLPDLPELPDLPDLSE